MGAKKERKKKGERPPARSETQTLSSGRPAHTHTHTLREKGKEYRAIAAKVSFPPSTSFPLLLGIPGTLLTLSPSPPHSAAAARHLDLRQLSRKCLLGHGTEEEERI